MEFTESGRRACSVRADAKWSSQRMGVRIRSVPSDHPLWDPALAANAFVRSIGDVTQLEVTSLVGAVASAKISLSKAFPFPCRWLFALAGHPSLAWRPPRKGWALRTLPF